MEKSIVEEYLNMKKHGQLYPYRGTMPSIHPDAFIAQTAVVIGDTHIGKDSGIWYGCVVRGDVNEIRIGERTNIQDLSMIHCAELGQGTYLGNDITVGHSAVLHACTIEDEAFIGIQACVMDDCLVEAGAMVAAGALVTPGKIVKTGEVWAGQPAKKLRDINQNDMDFFTLNRKRYARLAAEYQQEQFAHEQSQDDS
jgi:carbonic anhydrase/acetyltransferase-like protein (isoleucine patch superfamily)